MTDEDTEFGTRLELVGALLVLGSIASFAIAVIGALASDPWAAALFGAGLLVIGVLVLAVDGYQRGEFEVETGPVQRIDEWERENL